MRDNKGVSLITLVIMIVIMIIMAAIVIRSSTETYSKALASKADTERMEIIKAAETRFGEYVNNNTLNPLVGTPIDYEGKTSDELKSYLGRMFANRTILNDNAESDYGALQDAIAKFVDENIEHMEYTRIIDASTANELGVNNIANQSLFLVNYYNVTTVVGPMD